MNKREKLKEQIDKIPKVFTTSDDFPLYIHFDEAQLKEIIRKAVEEKGYEVISTERGPDIVFAPKGSTIIRVRRKVEQ